MSQNRPIFNDGQGLATPDLAAPCNLVGFVDDRVHEVFLTPGAVLKRVVPLSEESSTVNPRLLAVPGTSTIGAVKVQPAQFITGSAAQTIANSATLYSALESTAIASNTSGLTRYDLIYATISRVVTQTGNRKIKSATDGTLSTQSINLSDAMSVTVAVNQGFLTGATAPTSAQIAAATPSDSIPVQGAQYGTYSFPIAYVTVANGYTSGTALGQGTGTSYIVQCWPGGFVRAARVRGFRPGSIYFGTDNEKPATTISAMTQGAERISGDVRLFVHFKNLPSTGFSAGTAATLDSAIDWRNRFVWGSLFYFGTATGLPYENLSSSPFSTSALQFAAYIGSNGADINSFSTYSGAATIHLAVSSSGVFGFYRVGNPVDATNGDVLCLVVYATDRLLPNS